ncbi:MAG: PrgI family mobile element protein [Minisyncoccota bacterium]
MQFKVPQFIDLEDQIFGSFTWKESLFVAGGVGVGYVLYTLIHIFPFNVLAGVSAVGAGAALAFYPKEHFGRPFSEIVEAAFKFTFSEKLYTWKKIPKPVRPAPEVHKVRRGPLLSVPNVSHGKISDAALEASTRPRQ